MKPSFAGVGLAVGIGLAAAFPAAAQGPPAAAAPRDEIATHVVQPGETLEVITEHYLGTAALWRENWKLNPELADPHLLHPGDVLRVIVERRMPARHAELVDLAPRVDERRVSEPAWTPAEIGNLLFEGDGVRTYEGASAELELDDQSRVTVTESSMVFLRRMETTVTKVDADTIEVREGQADLAARVPRPRSREIRIVVGGATARPAPDVIGRVENRARRAAGGDAELMVYTGSTAVEAAGSRVSVPQGMGTRVPRGEPPRPPEPLLEAPLPLSPPRASRWSYANPRFIWEPVAEAASYKVEVCRDAACGRLVARAVEVESPAWQPERLPAADLFWRVTAVGSSGLDGYPSRGVAFAVTGDLLDTDPPLAEVRRVGAGRRRTARSFLLGVGGGLELTVRDDASGVRDVRVRWDEGPWEERQADEAAAGALVTPPAAAGAHTLTVEATDHLDRTSTTHIEVETDLTAPPAPTVDAGQSVPAAATAHPPIAGPPGIAAACVDGPCTTAADGTLRLGRGARLRLTASGDGPLRYRWDEGPWETWTGEPVLPPGPGLHLLAVEAGDAHGLSAWSLRVESASRH